MNKELEQLRQAGTKLRADLMASNMAILALISALTPEQQKQALETFVTMSVMQEKTAEQSQQSDLIGLIQGAMQRQYSGLEGAVKMSAAQAKEG